jgi:hypothetical protein
MWAGGEGWEAGWYVKEGDLFVLLWKPAGASRAGGESQAESQEGRGGPRLGGAPFPRRKRKGEAQFLLPCRPLPAWPPQDSERFLALLQAARTGLCCIPTSPDSWRWMQSVAGGFHRTLVSELPQLRVPLPGVCCAACGQASL